jgi:hypothetical protein
MTKLDKRKQTSIAYQRIIFYLDSSARVASQFALGFTEKRYVQEFFRVFRLELGCAASAGNCRHSLVANPQSRVRRCWATPRAAVLINQPVE